jgi:hypothetical protein
MQLFPLLVQFGVLLFASALSVYLWTIHISLALIVLALTSLGVFGIHFTACINCDFSRLSFPNSPGSTDSLADSNCSLDQAERNSP